jgi:hypothetical protein
MSSRRVTRRTSSKLRHHASRHHTSAQMVAALDRMIHLGEGRRAAALHTNAMSITIQPHTIHHSSVVESSYS